MRFSPGARLGPYEIPALLGVGGMGEVYRAHDSRLGRDVAVKVLPESVSEDRERLKRFEQEARAAAALNHPNILAVYDVGSHQGSPYIVSELLLGETLRGRLSSGTMTVQEALGVATPLARALAAAHEKGIVHRDLKPENVFLTRDDQVKVLDFGLAKLRPSPEELASGSPTATRPTADGVVMGTVAYMSPEQVRGQATSASSDLFSFGVVLYEMLGGRRPFVGESTADVMAAILNQAPAKLDVPVSPLLERITERCLEKRPEDRFHSAHDLALALEALSHAESVPTTTAPRPLRRRRWIFVTAVLLLGTGVGWILWRSRAASETRASITSIAVLPLENLSGDPKEEYFVDGMTDELIAQLAQVSALKVISRTSVMQYKSAPKPIPEIARELGVDAVVEGSVRRSGNRVRITAQLIEGATDHHLWAQSLDRDMGDVLSLQSEVARALVQEIRVTVTPSEEARLGRTRSVDPEAYQLYLKGNYLMLQMSSYERALDAYQQAIERDPRFAPAYAGLAMAHMEIGGWLGSVDPREVKARAKEAIDRALEVDDTAADAYMALGTYEYNFEWDWARAEHAFQRGLELTPSSSYARMNYANFLTHMGRFDDSIALGRQTLAIDPLSPAAYDELALALECSRRDGEVLALLQKALELDPNFPIAHMLVSIHYFGRGQLQEAIASAENAVRLAPALTMFQAYLGYVYGMTGRREEARRILEGLERRLVSEYVSPVDRGKIYWSLGEEEKAMDLLETGFEEGDFRMVLLKACPWFYPFQSHPRFQDLVRRMRFPN